MVNAPRLVINGETLNVIQLRLCVHIRKRRSREIKADLRADDLRKTSDSRSCNF